MAQNIIIPNKDNKVVLTFAGVDLTLATDIVVQFGSETYSTSSNPTLVVVDSASQLSLDLSSTAEVGQLYLTITYFDDGSVNGTDITSREISNLDRVIVAIGTQLIIEDGTVVANANSFVTDAELKAYADLRGVDLPATQPEREALLVLAMDYLFSVESKFQGKRVEPSQELPFPRIGVYLNGFTVDGATIPKSLKNAQMELAIQANSSDLLINEQSQNIASEKVDTLQVSYFSGGKWATVRTGKADAYLSPLFVNVHGRLIRI